ncbi:unnamed protein product [Phytomonas sp. EM1]|nr:unnamed protein product [Phytomonas sp. EM1]|eukprot:CCW65537.1 unnamed protein product [Phytomonas sp. isolate EM1]
MLEMKVILTELQHRLLLERSEAVVELIKVSTGATMEILRPIPNAIITAEKEMGLIAAEIELKCILSCLIKRVGLTPRPRKPVFSAVETFLRANQTILAPGQPEGAEAVAPDARTLANPNPIHPISNIPREDVGPHVRPGSLSIPRGVIQHPSVQRSRSTSERTGGSPPPPPSSGVVIRMPPELQRRLFGARSPPARVEAAS